MTWTHWMRERRPPQQLISISNRHPRRNLFRFSVSRTLFQFLIFLANWFAGRFSINFGSTIVKAPPLIFFFGGGRFAIVNFRSQPSPQIKKTNRNHSTTIKRIKKKEKKTMRAKNVVYYCASQKSCLLLHVFIRIYNCN